MDEQQERDYYQQQKNIPIVTPNLFRTYNPIWTSTLANSRSKSAKWFARLLLVFLPSTIYRWYCFRYIGFDKSFLTRFE